MYENPGFLFFLKKVSLSIVLDHITRIIAKQHRNNKAKQRKIKKYKIIEYLSFNAYISVKSKHVSSQYIY